MSNTCQYLEAFNFDLCEIELFDHLTVSKQIIELLVLHSNTFKCLTLLTYAKLNC